MTGAYVGRERHEIPDASIVTRIAQQVGGSPGYGLEDLADAFDQAFWWATGCTAVATVLALLLPNRKRPG